VYNFHVPLVFEGRPVVSVCDRALVFIVLCVGLMAIFCGVAFLFGFLFYWCVFCCSSFMVWCVSAAGGVFACSDVTNTNTTKNNHETNTQDDKDQSYITNRHHWTAFRN
jgi:hypothetical protein